MLSHNPSRFSYWSSPERKDMDTGPDTAWVRVDISPDPTTTTTIPTTVKRGRGRKLKPGPCLITCGVLMLLALFYKCVVFMYIA